MKKIIPSLIILIGIGLLCYPWLAERYDTYQQQRLAEAWQSLSLAEDNQATPPADHSEADEVEEQARRAEELQREEALQREVYIKKNLDGMLKIDKINLNLPILRGPSEKNLKISVASMTGKAGEQGNYAIAGHRNRTYGRNFNRLDEVVVGDTIEVNAGPSQFTYTVTEKLYVKPEEVWVLNSVPGKKEITLITCHPMVKPTHRLIIKGKL